MRQFVQPGQYGFSREAQPTLTVHQPGDVDPVAIYEQYGIQAWALDLDGSFIPPRAEATDPVALQDDAFVSAILAHPELSAVIATNRACPDIGPWARDTALARLPVFHADDHLKPDIRFFGRVIRHFESLGICATRMAILGDGLYHDVLSANRLGCFSVFVARIDPYQYFNDFTEADNDI